MNPLALALVLAAAVLHATWNLSAKRAAGGDGLIFVALISAVSAALALPFGVAAWVAHPPAFAPVDWVVIVTSGVVHAVYFLLLQRGYRHGDLSTVYPVARGTGPLFAVAAAVVLLGERPGATGSVGIVAILSGIVLVSGLLSVSGGGQRSAGVGWGVVIGLSIATYTVVDALAVTSLHLDPFIFFFLSLTVSALILAPFVVRDPAKVRTEWHGSRRQILAVGILSPVAYTLVLFALRLAPLAYVAPLREVSMMIGVVYGAWLLHERVTALRVAGVVCMAVGVAALALA